MATRTWSGAGDGVTFTSGSNWSGGTPANDDTLIVNSTSAAIAGAARAEAGGQSPRSSCPVGALGADVVVVMCTVAADG